jgi:amidohydrolase
VIPETANFAIDARAQSNELMDELRKLTQKIADETMEETGASIDWSVEELVPAATLHKHATELVESAIKDILGENNVISTCVSQGGEDFHFYTAKNPGIAATMIGLGCGLSPGLHHPQMKFNLDALIYGTKILTRAVLLASKE